MLHAYAYGADPQPLIDAGAEKVWYDPKGERGKRVDMMQSGALRDGDILLLLSFHNLAGSPQAYDRWQADMAALGVTLRIVVTNAPPRPVGRPRKYDPTPRQKRRHWAIWTDGHPPETDRLAAIAADYGSPVTRQTLNGRYGNPSNPKPAP